MKISHDEFVAMIKKSNSFKDMSDVEIADILGGYYKYWKLETVNIEKLKPKPRARINPAAIAFNDEPIIVDRNFNIIDGHHRYFGALKNKMDSIRIYRPGPYE